MVEAQPFFEMTWRGRSGQGFSGRTAPVLPACTICHQHVQRATVHAEGDGKRRGLFCFALQLGLLHAAAAPSSLVHREKAARGLVDVDDAVCADSVLVHQPAELDEHSMRVGVLLLRAVELLEALGGPLEAQAHAMQEPPYPPFAGTDVESLCVEPFVHEALESYSTQAQDVGDAHDCWRRE